MQNFHVRLFRLQRSSGMYCPDLSIKDKDNVDRSSYQLLIDQVMVLTDVPLKNCVTGRVIDEGRKRQMTLGFTPCPLKGVLKSPL